MADSSEHRVAHVIRSGDGIERVPAVSLAFAKRGAANAVMVADAILERAAALEGPLIIVRNSILLVDFIRNADHSGKTQLDILLATGATWFKPILLTA